MHKGFAPILFLIGTIILIIVVAGSYFYYQKNISSSVKNSAKNADAQMIVYEDQLTPTSTPSSPPDETANWEKYTNKELKFEFKRPPNWSEPQSEYGAPSFPFTFGYTSGNNPIDAKDVNKTYWITVGFISQSQLSVMGITYCGANPNDSPRCQKTQIGNVSSEIDWGTPEDKTAYVSIPHSNGGIVTFQLNPVNTESKKTFNQILSTFKFLD